MARRQVALTGGIATGKSTCLAAFGALGVPTIDADVLAHNLIRSDTPGFAAVVAQFGAEIVGAGGEIDRERLGRRVFADVKARRALEAILHPAIYRAIAGWFETQPADIAIADVPLLYETHRERDFDLVVVAACGPDQQIERLRARNGFSEDDARARLASQWPIATKVERADFVIDTSGTRDETHRQVVEVYERLLALASQRSG